MNKNILIFFISFLTSAFFSYAQHIEGLVVKAVIIDGDTVPVISLPEIKVFAPIKFKNKIEEIQFTKLMRNVKKVYPLARIAAAKMIEYNEIIEKKTYSEAEKRKLMKIAEDDLKKEFEGQIRKLTFSQGKILIKLIDRETKNTSYELIAEFRGKVIASFWQSLARIFGMNLKMEYDPYGTDKDIERIVQMIENGTL